VGGSFHLLQAVTVQEVPARVNWNLAHKGALLAARQGPYVEGNLMLRRHRVKHTASLEARIAERVEEIRAKADALPLGSRERERLELRARQADTANHITEWLTSPGLRRPD